MLKHPIDGHIMLTAYNIARWSRTKGDKVGSILVTPDVAFIDRCELPEGVSRLDSRYEKPDRFIWLDHAERRVIYSAARLGVATEGATIYTTWFPCVECAKAISQAGISKVVGMEPEWENKRWNFWEAKQILQESGVEIEFFTTEYQKFLYRDQFRARA